LKGELLLPDKCGANQLIVNQRVQEIFAGHVKKEKGICGGEISFLK
jgi:hypothetical protein